MQDAAHIDTTDRLERLRAMRDRLVDLTVASYAAHDKSILAAAGGGLAVSTTVVGMLLARGYELPLTPLVAALVGFSVAMLVVIYSHKLSACAAERACDEIDLELSGKIRTANTTKFNSPVHSANTISALALIVGVTGLVWLILATAQAGAPKSDDGVRGAPAPKIDPRPAPPKPQPQPKPAK